MMSVAECKYLAGIRIHNKYRNILCTDSIHIFIYIFLNYLLNLSVNGGYYSISILCRLSDLLCCIVIGKVNVGTSILTIKVFIVFTLDTAESDISAYDEAQHMTSENAVRILSDIALLEPYADNIILFFSVFIELLDLLV